MSPYQWRQRPSLRADRNTMNPPRAAVQLMHPMEDRSPHLKNSLAPHSSLQYQGHHFDSTAGDMWAQWMMIVNIYIYIYLNLPKNDRTPKVPRAIDSIMAKIDTWPEANT